MQINNNKKSGNSFENEFCELMKAQGYYAHLNTPGKGGQQPFDVQLLKNNRSAQVDCKVCHEEYFSLSNIRENQRTAFRLLESLGSDNNYIVVKFAKSDKIKIIRFSEIDFGKTRIHESEFYEISDFK